MGCLQLEVIAEKPTLVKPAAPTKRSTVYLHNIDQQVFFHLELLFVYDVQSGCETGDAVDRLRDALSEILGTYDFVAGRFRVNEEEGRLELDCNGEGALFAGAYCNSATIDELGDFRGEVNPEFRKLLVYPPNVERIEDIPLFTVQATRFKCGGVVVGIYTHHIVLDGVSGGDFFVNYARLAAGKPLEEVAKNPSPDRTVLKARSPPRVSFRHPEMVQLPDFPARILFDPSSFNPEKPLQHTTKIFPFSAAQLNQLKKTALADGTVGRCSTFEALAGHLWRAKQLADATEDNQQELAKLFVAMELRHKLKEQPLPSNFSGNAVIAAPCVDVTLGEVCSSTLAFAVKQVQKTIGNVTEEFIRSQLDWCEKMGHGIINVPGSVIITPWYKLRFEEVDFGWGKPRYILPCVSERTEYVLVIPNCKNDAGVDVFMAIDSAKMPKLEEFLAV